VSKDTRDYREGPGASCRIPRGDSREAYGTETALDFNFDSDVREFDDYVTLDLLDTFNWFNESWITRN
jgi:hypothetical protein